VPRLTARLTGHGARLPVGADVWGDTRVVVPAELAAPTVDAFTGALVRATARDGSELALAAGDLLARFPVALLGGQE